MNGAKHTPGWWEVGPLLEVRALTGRSICHAMPWSAEGEANARLIAAAPRMLAALQMLAARGWGNVTPSDYQEILNAIEAAGGGAA